MKKLKQIAVVLAITLSMYISVDDAIYLCLNIDSVEIPVHSNSSDINHHHHFSIADHFCQKNSGSNPEPESAPRVQSLFNNQPLAQQFLCSIWQPPQINS